MTTTQRTKDTEYKNTQKLGRGAWGGRPGYPRGQVEDATHGRSLLDSSGGERKAPDKTKSPADMVAGTFITLISVFLAGGSCSGIKIRKIIFRYLNHISLYVTLIE
jgi:hypothetical protein